MTDLDDTAGDKRTATIEKQRPEKAGGYFGAYLRIDVTSGQHSRIEIPPDALRQFIGGSGLGTWLLLQEGAAVHDPCAADSTIVFSFSPLVGSPLTTSAKFAVVCRSPLTDRINDSLASSGFALTGKRTGHDLLTITGRATEPSLLLIDDGEVQLLPAGDVWGTTCTEAQRLLHERFVGDWQTAVIGPAGEQQVRYATISHDGRHAGRGGSGAVLGSKNIKAILVRGSKRSEWAQPRELALFAKDLSARSFGPATAKYRELGTASNLLLFNRLKVLPTRNFQEGSFEGAIDLAPETLSQVRERTRAYCAACTIGCEHIFSLRGQGDAAPSGVRLEYENLFALGPLCGINDPDIVLAASKRCDELGLDTISAGGTIAFAMECAERGWLDAPWLRFGRGDSLLRALDEIAFRKGLGNELAEGSLRLAHYIGHGSIEIAPQVKGLEIPGYEPRALQTMALGFAVGTRGADHNRSGAYEVDFSGDVDRRNLTLDAVARAIDTEDKAALMDSLILCKFLRGVFSNFYAESAEMLHLVTGWDLSEGELRQASRQIINAKKRFNVLAGWTPAEDTLPARFLQQPLADDAQARLSPEQLSAAVREYNLQRGWTADGYPQ